jgi:hypothetical protein
VFIWNWSRAIFVPYILGLESFKLNFTQLTLPKKEQSGQHQTDLVHVDDALPDIRRLFEQGNEQESNGGDVASIAEDVLPSACSEISAPLKHVIKHIGKHVAFNTDLPRKTLPRKILSAEYIEYCCSESKRAANEHRGGR